MSGAYVLHQRPWGDSGRIFELFSRDHGRLSVFAQGVRGPRARLAGVMQPFVPLAGFLGRAGRGAAPHGRGVSPRRIPCTRHVTLPPRAGCCRPGTSATW